MFLQLKALFATLGGIVAALATWLLVDASGLTTADFLYRGDNSSGTAAANFIYQFTFAIFLSIMLAAADAIFRETPAQRRTEYLIATACGLGGGLIGPGIGIGLAALFPAPAAAPDGVSGPFLLDVFLLSIGWAIVGGTAGAVPGIARKSLWIAQRGAIGGATGTVFGATLFQLSTTIFDQDSKLGLLWRLGSLVLMGALSGLGSSLLPDMVRQVWLRAVTKRGVRREYTIGRSPFRIGKDPGCDIVIPETSSIAPVHVMIEAIPQTKRHRIRHAARSPMGTSLYSPTRLNDETMTSEKWLTDGDRFCIGYIVFEFRETATHVEAPEPPRVQDRPYAEDRKWPLTQAKTTAIPVSMLPISELGHESVDGAVPEATATSTERQPDAPAPVRAERQPDAPAPVRSTAPRTDAGSELSTIGTTLEPASANGTSAKVARVAPANHLPSVEGTLNIIGTRLACVGGPYLGQSFPLSYQTAVIGRSLGHAIALPADTSVSRIHARIVYESGRHVISDHGSSNGLLVNDEPVVEPRTLRISDIIAVGSTLLRYE